jgi:hypothetical protein
MKKIHKKELKEAVEKAMSGVLAKLNLPAASKKTRKAIAKVAKALKEELKSVAKKSADKKNKKVVPSKSLKKVTKKKGVKKKSTPAQISTSQAGK